MAVNEVSLNVVEGKIKRIVSEKNGFVIASIESTTIPKQYISKYGTYTVVGFGMLIENESYSFSGMWTKNNNYGWNFSFREFKKIVPTTVESIENYLKSKTIKGVGPELAERLVSKFGLDTLDVLKSGSTELKTVKGIGEKKFKEITESYKKNSFLEDLSLFLSNPQYKITPRKISKIYQTFGKSAISVISKNPYMLEEKIDGFGFKTVDKIAMNLKMPEDFLPRLRAGIIYCLKDAAETDGHVYLPNNELKEKFYEIFPDMPIGRYERAIKYMIEQNDIVVIGKMDKIYLSYFYMMETEVSKMILNLATDVKPIENLDILIDKVQKEDNIALAEKQCLGIKSLNDGNLIVITGGPGTGKSTLIKELIKVLVKHNSKVNIALCAPTGRAAKRMEEATGYESTTIHRRFKLIPSQGYQVNENNPLDADVLIIDECSMIDISLMYNLLRGIKKGTRVIMIGDIDQLPPVGAGYPFRDIVLSRAVPVVVLNMVFRQGNGSPIKINAYKIKNGETNIVLKKDEFEYYTKFDDNEKMRDFIVAKFMRSIAEEKISDSQKYLYNVQILSPIRKGILGVEELNKSIQKIINPPSPEKAEIVFKNREGEVYSIFRINDKVLQIKNDYDKFVFNGDIGIITNIFKADNKISIEVTLDNGKKIIYERGEIYENLILAYATTVHKSQGSEYNQVIIVNALSHVYALQRNTLYTAITRAKKKAVVVGEKKAFFIAVHKTDSFNRYSQLGKFLQKAA